MKYIKKESMGSFLKKGEDFKEGDLLEIANEGKKEEGTFGIQDIFLMKIGEKEGNLSINQTSINAIIDAYGEDSINWIGKKVKATKVKMSVGGKFKDVWYFAHPDAEFTEDGFEMTVKDDIPVVEEPKKKDDGEIDVKNIPF